MGQAPNFQAGVDPRTAGIDHRERGPKRFSFTYEDIAEAFGVKPQTVRNWAALGKIDPDDLGSIVRFWSERLSKT